ncbi:MAG TPA: hypothetical protein VFU78_19855 [Thermomicrobiales bacterium]|nr:hypothetical protein [Thermomicrobiales bacterium]
MAAQPPFAPNLSAHPRSAIVPVASHGADPNPLPDRPPARLPD